MPSRYVVWISSSSVKGSLLRLLQHLVERPDVVFGDLNGLEFRELPVVSVPGQEVPQAVEGGVELAHPLPLAVVGVQALLALLQRREHLGAGAALLRGGRREGGGGGGGRRGGGHDVHGVL